MDNNWKPKIWVAIALGVILQAFTFLYLNRPKIFWVYFLLSCVVSIIDWKFQTFFSVVFSLICPIHALFVVKHFKHATKRGWYSTRWGLPVICATYFVSVFLFRSFLYEPFIFPSASMRPTINQGNHLVVKKLGFGTYGTYGMDLISSAVSSSNLMQRGKLYAFYPPHTDTPFVKRLMAIPGDKVAIRDNAIRINGALLTKERLYKTDDVTVYQQQLDGISYSIQHINGQRSKDMEAVVVPENSYFFLGDNRDNSADSRVWGYVTSDRIIGEVLYIIE
ncbi:signal peptidase I [Neptunomonas phycophila]|uniref:signal peptidase I n=1 Tax=Neptunomonas phycophila TaxID=1572645 RepID=UPI0023F93DF9|nr:signal peptidase I [Neptunomonas phycophila]